MRIPKLLGGNNYEQETETYDKKEKHESPETPLLALFSDNINNAGTPYVLLTWFLFPWR